jgi:hypothetical protein
MKKVLIIFCFSFFWHGGTIASTNYTAVRDSVEKSVQFPDAGQFTKATLDHRIIDSEAGTYGYDIYADGKRLIHQPTIPGLTGNRGFPSKAGAEKAAQLVIGKIRNGEMPPSVTQEELEKSGALEK